MNLRQKSAKREKNLDFNENMQMCPNLSTVYFPSSPTTPHKLTHPAAVQQVSSPSLSGPLVLTQIKKKKKNANLSRRRHNCHYDCCGPAHHTQCTDCSTEEEGANTVCSVQTSHNIIIAWLQLIHTLTHSLYLTHFCLLGLTNFSIKHRANKVSIGQKNPYSTAFKKSLTVKPWVNTHSHSATANRKW